MPLPADPIEHALTSSYGSYLSWTRTRTAPSAPGRHAKPSNRSG